MLTNVGHDLMQFALCMVFTASAVYAMALSVSVRSRCSTKMAKHRITIAQGL